MNRKVKQMMAVLMALILLSFATTSASARVLFSDPVSPTVNLPKDPTQEGQPSDAGEEPLPEGSLPEELPTEEPLPVEEAVVTLETAEGSLNVRAAASSDSELLVQIPNGARVVALGTEGNWLLIQYETIVGYAYSEYMEVLPPAVEGELPEEPQPEEEPLSEEPLEEELFPSREVIVRDNLGSTVHYGDHITLTGELLGFEGTAHTLQWMIRNQGGDWKEIPGENSLSITFELTPENAASEWRLNVITE